MICDKYRQTFIYPLDAFSPRLISSQRQYSDSFAARKLFKHSNVIDWIYRWIVHSEFMRLWFWTLAAFCVWHKIRSPHIRHGFVTIFLVCAFVTLRARRRRIQSETSWLREANRTEAKLTATGLHPNSAIQGLFTQPQIIAGTFSNAKNNCCSHFDTFPEWEFPKSNEVRLPAGRWVSLWNSGCGRGRNHSTTPSVAPESKTS